MLLKKLAIIGGFIFKRECCCTRPRCLCCSEYKKHKTCADIDTSLICDYINETCTAGYLNFHNLYYVAKC